MRKFLLCLTVAAVAAGAARPGQASPRVFMHLEGYGQMPCYAAGPGTACALPTQLGVLLPHIAGAQLYVPWSTVQTTDPSGFDWSHLENVIRPWAAAGKKVGISFHATENTSGVDKTGISALPAFITSPPPGHVAPRTVACRLTASGQSWSPPANPVWWDPNYEAPWRAFAAAAIRHFAGRPDVAYLRFGEGQSDESMVQVTKTIGLGVATPTSQNACDAIWNSVDAQMGGHGVFADMVGAATGLDVSIGQVRGATPGAPPVFETFNDMGPFQNHQTPQPHPYADRVAAAQSAAGLVPGNEGFGDQSDGSSLTSTKFVGIYKWTDAWFAQNHVARPVATFMQTSAPAKRQQFTTLPQLLQSAVGLGIGTFELYSKDLYVIFDPHNTSKQNPYAGPSPSPSCLSLQAQTALAGHPIPSCS